MRRRSEARRTVPVPQRATAVDRSSDAVTYAESRAQGWSTSISEVEIAQ